MAASPQPVPEPSGSPADAVPAGGPRVATRGDAEDGGHILGDEGSGYWIGLAAIRAALAHRDGRGAATALTTAVLSYFQIPAIEDVMVPVYRRFDKAYIAGFAKQAAECARHGDQVALGLFRQAAAGLAAQVEVVYRRLGFTAPVDLTLVGGTFKAGEIFTGWLREDLAELVRDEGFSVPSSRQSEGRPGWPRAPLAWNSCCPTRRSRPGSMPP